MPRPLKEAHKIIRYDLLLDRVPQDGTNLDTTTSQNYPRSFHIITPIKGGVCKTCRQRHFRKDLTEVSTSSSDKEQIFPAGRVRGQARTCDRVHHNFHMQARVIRSGILVEVLAKSSLRFPRIKIVKMLWMVLACKFSKMLVRNSCLQIL